MQLDLIAPTALSGAKWAFTTRRVRRLDAARLDDDVKSAKAGDLVLARVEKIGSHKRIQTPAGRPADLYPGDMIVVACGARYAADQFEGVASISEAGADLLAGGGVIGRMRARNERIAPPTRVAPIGLLADASGRRLNLQRYAAETRQPVHDIATLCVAGAGMNSGKTMIMAALAHGLSRAGHRVAALKLTGTGAFGDWNAYADAGAAHVADFVDAGFASTYGLATDRILSAFDTLKSGAVEARCNVVLVELADGLLQAETAALVGEPAFRDACSGVVFAAPDALSALGGVGWLAGHGITPLAISGALARSPLAMAEAQDATGCNVLTRAALCDPSVASALLANAPARSTGCHRAAMEKAS